MNVKASRIEASIEEGRNLAGLKETLGCGTQCGSCVPELKRMLANAVQVA